MRGRPIAFGFILACLISGCGRLESPPPLPQYPSTEEALALATAVGDCESRAANQYDNQQYKVSELAERVVGICTVQRFRMRQAFHVSLNDPEVDLDDFKRAIDIVERERRARER